MKNQKNASLKERQRAGETVLGTWCLTPSPHVANIIAAAGLDFIIIDMEHGSMDLETAGLMVMAAEAENCSPVIRVPRNEESDILRVLETGAAGVVVPHIGSVAERQAVVKAAKYPPVGERGFSPYPRAGMYHSTPNHTQMQNEKTLVVVIVEGLEAIENIDKIAADPNIDVVYIGTYDLSAALGIAGQVGHKKVLDLLAKSVEKVRKTGRAAGCMAHSPEEAAAMRKMGIQFLLYGVDTAVLYDGYRQIRGQVKP